MLSTGVSELFVIVPVGVMALVFSVIVFFCFRKVCQKLSMIDDNLTRIRKSIESASLLRL